jgi:selenocysteine-specific elongation factor
MPIDRSFVIHGHGTVVTGTATAGEVQAEQRLHVLPGSRAARVRGIQVHGTAVQHARRGQRIALNLGGVDAGEIERGQVVCDVSLDRVSDRIDAFVELRPAAGRPLQRHSLVRLHNGTAEAMAKIIYLDGRESLAPKDQTYAQLALREPIAIFGGDRFILREQTGRATIGGGLVLYPFATKPEKPIDPRLPVLERLHRAANLRDRLDALIALQSSPLVTSDELAAAANLRVSDVHSVLADHPSLRRFPDGGRPDAYATSAGWNELSERITGLLAAHHSANPREAGLDIESLRSGVAAGTPPKVFRAVVADLEKSGAAVRQDNLLRLPQHEIRIDRKQAALAERVLEVLDRACFTPPDPATLAAELGVSASDFDVCVEQLERENRAHRIEPKLVYSEAVLERVRDLIRGHVAEHGEIDARALRDAIGASRKYSIALLTYFDRSGFTMRVGDTRKLRAR